MDWSLCAWCGKDFERREVPAAIEMLPRDRDATGQNAVPLHGRGVGDGRRRRFDDGGLDRQQSPVVHPSLEPAATGGSPIPASAQDPLPER